MTSWLNRQRKQTLLDLSTEAGLQQEDDLRKDDIVEALDAYLQQNATRLSRNETFEPYYGLRKTPFKARSSSTIGAGGVTSDDGEVKSVVKGRGRRSTKVKQEFDDDDYATGAASASSPAGPSSTLRPRISDALASITNSSTALTNRTPGRPRRQTQLPASPADVAAYAEHETARFYAGLNDAYSVSGIPDLIDYLRTECSSLMGLQYTFFLLESLGIQSQVLPWVYTGLPIHSVRGFGVPSLSIYHPDLFALLTSEFWYPVLLYFATSYATPALIGYFFNLGTRNVRRHGAVVSAARYPVDPLVFNAVKALLATVVYGNGLGAAVVGPEAVAKIDAGTLSGGLLMDSYFMILASVYDAALRK